MNGILVWIEPYLQPRRIQLSYEDLAMKLPPAQVRRGSLRDLVCSEYPSGPPEDGLLPYIQIGTRKHGVAFLGLAEIEAIHQAFCSPSAR